MTEWWATGFTNMLKKRDEDLTRSEFRPDIIDI